MLCFVLDTYILFLRWQVHGILYIYFVNRVNKDSLEFANFLKYLSNRPQIYCCTPKTLKVAFT